jgi:hypothetical protein
VHQVIIPSPQRTAPHARARTHTHTHTYKTLRVATDRTHVLTRDGVGESEGVAAATGGAGTTVRGAAASARPRRISGGPRSAHTTTRPRTRGRQR